MKLQTPYTSWEYKSQTKTIRLDRRFEFDTPEDSELFAQRVGTAISFPNLAVFVDPLFGSPEARVSIECNDDSVSLATAHHLLESFSGLHARH
ncbi:hypothetical protein [Coraliomargarita akajimensis]|uniref:Uncharacterized protein n=1 Tax=Coraliomargarita akajimensis (strain DSM 45221 / IAM 15411 / JCM 23193 / KCTC 12865 / 04OKA010-24) TaxID=583355 RepID=D5EL40_CORAD|nr:hypothetical protein [Coraliomargarita akajimensis]ADE53142.1 hypothetical protein Caka_0113 [Coraliomargarita akajimensis DSM 45221]